MVLGCRERGLVIMCPQFVLESQRSDCANFAPVSLELQIKINNGTVLFFTYCRFFPIYEGQNLRQNFAVFFAWKETLKKPKTKKILDEN